MAFVPRVEVFSFFDSTIADFLLSRIEKAREIKVSQEKDFIGAQAVCAEKFVRKRNIRDRKTRIFMKYFCVSKKLCSCGACKKIRNKNFSLPSAMENLQIVH